LIKKGFLLIIGKKDLWTAKDCGTLAPTTEEEKATGGHRDFNSSSANKRLGEKNYVSITVRKRRRSTGPRH